MVERCPTCNQVWIKERGLKNWKNLFRMPSLSDWITLFIILMVLFASWAYTVDINAMQEFQSNSTAVCELCAYYTHERAQDIFQQINAQNYSFNVSR